MKGPFADRSTFFQIGILLFATLIGYLIASTLSVPFLLLFGGGGTMPLLEMLPSVLLVLQFISAGCMFLLPPLVTAWLCSKQPVAFLQAETTGINIRLLVLATASLLLLSPTISLTGYLNSLMKLPEWMAPIEKWMIDSEETMAFVIDRLLSQKGIVAFILNLIVIAGMAGVSEEFFFRGALFSILRKSIRNHHVVIWIVAIIFSAIHFQFYGFIPRMLLGAYLGYLVYWTRSIWVPVFIHFLNNAIAVVGMSSESLKDNAFFTETLAADDLGWFSAVAVVCLVLFIFCTGMIRKNGLAKKEY